MCAHNLAHKYEAKVKDLLLIFKDVFAFTHKDIKKKYLHIYASIRLSYNLKPSL